MNPGDSKAMEGIQNVERVNGGEVEHDSGDEADEPNGGVSLEEVLACGKNMISIFQTSILTFVRVPFDMKKDRGLPLNKVKHF